MEDKVLAWIDPVNPNDPDYPVKPPGIWGPNDPRPTHPIVIPPDSLAPGIPAHPIVLPPPIPAHPIVIPPDAISPGVPTHPIVLPPIIWGPNDPRPTHPIVIPPDSLAPGIPTHPIYLPIFPVHPIVLPPSGEGWQSVYIIGLGWTYLKFAEPTPTPTP